MTWLKALSRGGSVSRNMLAPLPAESLAKEDCPVMNEARAGQAPSPSALYRSIEGALKVLVCDLFYHQSAECISLKTPRPLSPLAMVPPCRLAHVLVLAAGAGLVAATGEALPCAARTAKNGIVCECNATYCDSVAPLGTVAAGTAIVYTSSQAGARLARTTAVLAASQAPGTSRTISIDNTTTVYQRVRGFGNAFTDSSSLGYAKMSEPVQAMLLKQYWTQSDAFPAGIGMSVGRVSARCRYVT